MPLTSLGIGGAVVGVSVLTALTLLPALLFVIVTGAFTFTRIIMTKEMGLGMAVAVLVDATIIRTLLVPVTMRLLGHWNRRLPGRPVSVERAG